MTESDERCPAIPYGRVAITGAKGQLGTELVSRLGSICVGFDYEEFDLTDASQTRETLLRAEPDLVINAAAYTAVDKAESQEAACFAVNAGGVAHVARTCEELDCELVQISTDYVFGADVERRRPYLETDEPGPLNVYGRSKLAGEEAAAAWKKHLIVRTCGLYSANPHGPQRGRNFCDTMLVLARQGTSLRVVDDQWCTPTYVPHFVDMLLELMAGGTTGVAHATAEGATTWYRLANALFESAKLDVKVTPITTSEYPTPARRPAFSVLAAQRSATALAKNWRVGCTEYISDLNAVLVTQD